MVIYDGHCRFCRATSRALNFLGANRLAFLSLYDQRVDAIVSDLSREELREHVYVVEHDGTRHEGAGAVRYLTRRLPALWPLMPLLHFPGTLPLWRRAYCWVSKHRHRLNRDG